MATIRPLRGLRFNKDVGDLADIVAPPYDVISTEDREELAAQNPYNVVRLTLPESETDDRSKFVKYARSASRLEEWRREGHLQLEERPSFYRYTQVFTIPGVPTPITRTSLIVLIKVEPYANCVVLPHEQTFPKHKEDRLRILEATRSHLECIFGLYEDEDGSTHHSVVDAQGDKLAEITTSDSTHHTLERIDEAEDVAKIVQELSDKKLWIADGHHRYETALSFREMQGDKDGLIAEDFMMMAICSISDPGLVLLPTHRILNQLPVDREGLKARLSEHFEVTETPNNELMATIDKLAQDKLTRAFGVALPGGNGLVAVTKDIEALARQIDGPGSQNLKQLDVSILHSFIFAKLLGLTGHDFFGYTRIEQEALDSVEEGAAAAFLMNPPTVDDMRTIALGGDFMPQKSTYYYPKLLSGLVMWSLKDFEA